MEKTRCAPRVAALALTLFLALHDVAAAAQSPTAPEVPSLASAPQAVETAPETAVLPPVVVISGGFDFKPYAQMRKGIDAFTAHHALAPQSRPRFMVSPMAGPLATINELQISVVNDAGDAIDIPIGTDGIFSLPQLDAPVMVGARLALNRPRGQYQWRPYIRSPEVPAGALRLGDLRLECEMRWAIEREDDVGVAKRLFLDLLGGPCGSSRVRVRYASPRPLAEVTLSAGERTNKLPSQLIADDGRTFFPPLEDKSWPDSTLLTFSYRP